MSSSRLTRRAPSGLAWRLLLFLLCAVFVIVIADLAAYIWVAHKGTWVIRGDGEGYYLYLPAWFIDHDPSLLRTIARHFAGVDPTFAGLDRNSVGYTESYGIGVAVLQAPFFVVAQLLNSRLGGAPGGYAPADQIAVLVAAPVWGFAGIAALAVLLRRFFSTAVVLAALAALLLGTDFLHYLTYDASYSHAYSFAAVSFTLLALQRWEERPGSVWRAALLGLMAGIVILIRPTNLVLLVPVALYGVLGPATLRRRILELLRRRAQLLCALLIALGTVFWQSWQWHAESGSWLLRPYPRISFDWPHPHLLQTLVGFSLHGLLPWSPVAGFALLGFIWMRHRVPALFLGVAVAVLLDWYVISAWQFYWYGGGYGNRAFIDLFPLLALPLASLFAAARQRVARYALAAVVVAACAVTTVQMLHYWQGLIPPDGMPAPAYIHVLFST